MVSALVLPSWIVVLSTAQEAPPLPDPKGVPPLYWLWATCTRNAENFREGVKTALKPHSPAGRLWAWRRFGTAWETVGKYARQRAKEGPPVPVL